MDINSNLEDIYKKSEGLYKQGHKNKINNNLNNSQITDNSLSTYQFLMK